MPSAPPTPPIRILTYDGQELLGRVDRRWQGSTGIWFYLPPRSPELNRIECVWRSVKYQDMPVRACTTTEELHDAVDRALAQRAAAATPATTQICKIA